MIKLSMEQKAAVVAELHDSLIFARPAASTVLSTWSEEIMAEVAEIPRYRAMVHNIRAMIKERSPRLELRKA